VLGTVTRESRLLAFPELRGTAGRTAGLPSGTSAGPKATGPNIWPEPRVSLRAREWCTERLDALIGESPHPSPGRSQPAST